MRTRAGACGTKALAAWFCLSFLIGVIPGGPAAAQSGQNRRSRETGAKACATLALPADSITSISSSGDLTLASGRLAKLSDVRLASDAEGRLNPDTRAWLEAQRGRQAEVRAVQPLAPDRWGRIAVTITVDDEDNSVDLAGALVEAGLALVDPGAANVLCRPGLLALEDAARRAGRGVWAAPATERLIPADDTTALNAAIGRFSLIEGRIVAVGERRQRTYLDFGPKGRKAATVTIPKRAWRQMLGHGLSASILRGRTVRARGVIEVWRGAPNLEVAATDLIEILDEGGAGRR